MKRAIILVGCLFCLSVVLTASEIDDVKSRLAGLFNKAEHCYLMDDYQQLYSCINQYDSLLTAYRVVIDSTDVFQAYQDKMYGSYYYGLADDGYYAYFSEFYYRKSLNLFNSRVKTDNIVGMHANAVTLHQELAQLYYKIGRYPESKGQLDTVFTYFESKLKSGIDTIVPKYYETLSQMAICNARTGDYELAIAQIDKAIKEFYKKIKNEDYYEALRKKGKILMLQADNLGTTHYKAAIDCYQQYVNERYASIAKEMKEMNDSQRGQYWLATHQFLYDCCRLGNLAPEMLYNLALFSKDFLIRKNTAQTKWTQIRQALGKKECAIEFIQYFGRTDEKRLGCLVLRNNSKKPMFVDLFATDSLLNIPLSWYKTIGSTISSSEPQDKDLLYTYNKLPNLIWTEPLMSAIGDAEKIYFSPDGQLHLLAVEYLMPDTTKTCYRLSSTRVLLQKKNTPNLDRALLCGGIKYSTPIFPEDRDNDVVAYRFLAPQTTSIKDLKWTQYEIDSISAIRNNHNDTLLVGEKATDKAFLQLLKQNYNVIHISTHGYFGGNNSVNNDIKPLLNDRSMSQSGILFAGSAYTLTDKYFDDDLFDGVLSATELSHQDLSKSELIVLSACQTGLGRLTDDGIYGIQRGLKIAGANAMILSLWNVNDFSCNLLMRFFYEELGKQSKNDIHVAFSNARKRLLQEKATIYKFDASNFIYKKDYLKYNTPQHLNPFIIIDAY